MYLLYVLSVQIVLYRIIFLSIHQQSAERCVSTLLDLIQTKVNYVVQEAIVVIKDIFRKYPNK